MGVLPSRILLATDDSENADLAARAAVDITHGSGAELHVVRVWPGPPLPMSRSYAKTGLKDPLHDECEREAREVLRKQVWHATVAGGTVAGRYLREGRPAEEITALAREIGVDFVVVGEQAECPEAHASSPGRLGRCHEGPPLVRHQRSRRLGEYRARAPHDSVGCLQPPGKWFTAHDDEAQDSQDQRHGCPAEVLPSARRRDVHDRSQEQQADEYPCPPSEDGSRQWHDPGPYAAQHDQRGEQQDADPDTARDTQTHRELLLVEATPRSTPQRGSERQRDLEGRDQQEAPGGRHGSGSDRFLRHL
jgi:nucleotide-binding universal stress UspA family protein